MSSFDEFQRAVDRYYNATAMCKAHGKHFGHYRRTRGKAFLRALEAAAGIPMAELVQTEVPRKDVWAHPMVAYHLGLWCSPKLAIAVARVIPDWLRHSRS